MLWSTYVQFIFAPFGQMFSYRQFQHVSVDLNGKILCRDVLPFSATGGYFR